MGIIGGIKDLVYGAAIIASDKKIAGGGEVDHDLSRAACFAQLLFGGITTSGFVARTEKFSTLSY